MATAVVLGSTDRDGPLTNPWPWMIAGLIALPGAFLWVQIGGEAGTAFRVSLVLGGILAAAAGVFIRPGSATVLASAGAAAFIGAWALYLPSQADQWNSGRLFLAVVAVVALLAALIVLLPRVWRRVVVSVLVVLHFGGILSAVLSAPPGIWMAGVAYTYLYRPYLQFMYLTNAYHFYAPEPGPAYLFWFDIEYIEDEAHLEKWHWVKVPDLDNEGWPRYPLALQYQRRLALASLASNIRESSEEEYNLAAIAHARANIRRYLHKQPLIPRNADPIMRLRGRTFGPPTLESQLIVASYVRHVAFAFQEQHPGATITGIKLYRFEHHFLSAAEFARGENPQAPRTYLPSFWGEYDGAGALKVVKEDFPFLKRKGNEYVYQVDHRETPNRDGYLYWQLPFLRVNPDVGGLLINNALSIPRPPKEPDFLVKYHKGDTLDEKEQKAFIIGQKDYYMKLLQWDLEVDRAFAEIIENRPDHPGLYLGYVYLHAGEANWKRYPTAEGTEEEWKP